jgi:uncharacterized protein
MHVVTAYPDDLFNWIDLTTTDAAGAKAFYKGLFGWEGRDVPVDEHYSYTMMEIDGKSVAGLGPMPPEMQAQGIPSYWTSYVKHSDVDGVAAKITAAGGTLLFPPMDVMDEGRMLMAVDTTGATFGVWQPRNHIGAQLVNTANALVWNELQTNDPAQAAAFYHQVFGWEAATDANDYTVFAADGRQQAGMIRIDPAWGEMPPNWAVYIMVDDLDATAAAVARLGGKVMVPPTAAGEMGRFIVVQDPQGAVFTAMQFNGPVDPPPGA